ncbi:MAG: hypothetical protein JSV86_18410 [Gemmatimonadota bacterium]|nr:MAG: hypothetical protein JSV86_18410 [Gemmatimonadota bacterium]
MHAPTSFETTLPTVAELDGGQGQFAASALTRERLDLAQLIPERPPALGGAGAPGRKRWRLERRPVGTLPEAREEFRLELDRRSGLAIGITKRNDSTAGRFGEPAELRRMMQGS